MMARLTGGVSLSIIYPNYSSRLIARKFRLDHIWAARTKHSSHTKLFSNSLVACTHDLNPEGVRTIMTRQVLFVAFLIFMFCGLGLAQNPDYVDVERPQNTPLIQMPIGFISPLTGQVHVEIPLLGLQTRDGLSIRAAIKYDTAFWAVSNQEMQPQTGSPLYLSMEQQARGFHRLVTTTHNNSCPAGYTGTETVQALNGVLDATGLHPVSGNYYVTTFSCENANGIWYKQPTETINVRTDDGEYYVSMSVVQGGGGLTVWEADGTTAYDSPVSNTWQQQFDTNGNYISGSLTSPVLSAPYTTSPISTSGNTDCFSMTNSTASINIINSSGSTDTYTVNCTTYVSGTNSVKVLTSLILPDTTQYTFTYDPSHNYVLNGVTLPTGGQISFTYSSTPRYDGIYPQLASATFGGGTWTFNQTHSGNAVTTTVTAPPRFDVPSQSYVSDTSIYTGGASLTGSSLGEARYYSGSTTLLKTIDLTYFQKCLGSLSTTLNDTGQTAKVQYSYGTAGCSPAQKQEFDYGATTPTRTTVYQYLGDISGGIAYNSQYHIYNRPVSINVYPGANTSGTPLQQTLYTYDEYSQNYCTSGIPNLTNITGALMHDDTNHGGTFYARGNVTSTKALVSGSTYVTFHSCYDTLGNVTQTVDAAGNPTTFDYSDNWADSTCVASGTLTRAFPSVVTDALGFRQKTTRASCTGLKIAVADENDLRIGRVGSTFTYDWKARPLCVNYSDGGQSCSAYFMTAQPQYTTQTTLINSGLSKSSKTVLDSVGRVQQTQLASDPDGLDYVDTTYDALSRIASVSNPYRSTSESTYGIATYTYDALGRTTKVAEPDGSAVATFYSGNCTTVTDEAGKTRQSCVDGLGRLTKVLEDPGTSPHLNYETDYTYDALNNMLSATQNGSNPSNARVRTFVYDSLSRLTSASNPELGTTAYTYDLDGNVVTKVEPEANQTGSVKTTNTYAYDALNRLLSRTDTSPANANALYQYDGQTLTGCVGVAPPAISGATNLIGRRSAMCSGFSASSFSYDQMGRIQTEARKNQGSSAITKTSGYTYYKDGSPNTLTYPSGDVLTYAVGAAGRVTQMSDSANSYVGYSGHPATYAPQGALAGMIQGNTSSFAGIVTSNTYSDRLQPILISAGVSGGSSIFSLCYDFHLHQAISSTPCSFSSYSTGDNGNLFQIINNIDTTRSSAYIYDSLNRIAQAYTLNTTSANCWGETYSATQTAPGVLPATSGIDAWGNLTNRSGVTGMGTCKTESLSATASTKNQLSILTYDAAGDVTNDGNGNQPTYDAEKRIATDAGFTYQYDADGVRMNKSSGSAGTLYWLGPGGETLTETDLTGTINEEYVYFNGERIARVDRPSGAVHYYFSNHLGSASVITDASGNVQEQTDFYPFGGVAYTSGSDPNDYKFTGKERDSESGLDNFGARYNASTMGRFMTPDPSTNLVLRAINPQRWNMYAYAINNPTSYVDHDGRDAAAVNFSGMVGGLGHEGLLIINKDGTATYARFGPVDHSLGNLGGASAPGAVSIYNNIPTVQFGSNNLPTDDSIKAVAAAVAQDESTPGAAIDPSSVRINYFQTGSTDAALLQDWAQIQQEHTQGGTGAYCHYSVGSNNCAAFTRNGLIAGGAITAEQARGLLPSGVDPNSMFNQLRGLANINYEFDFLSHQLKHETACVEAHDSSGQGTGTHCE